MLPAQQKRLFKRLIKDARAKGCCVKPLPPPKKERWLGGPEVLVLRCPRCKKEVAVFVTRLPVKAA
jgi:hypothetical protein